MSQKGLSVLETLVQKFGPSVIHSVVLARDTSVLDDFYDAFRNVCNKNNIRYFDRTDEPKNIASISIAVSWRWLIPSAANHRLIVLHDSLLPRYRGFNPLVSALINGDVEIGATALFADTDSYDTGDIIAQRSITIQYPVKIQQVIDQVAVKYNELAIEICAMVLSGRPIPSTPQIDADATYSLWRDERDYQINWELPADLIMRHIHAVGYPYKGATSVVDGITVRILDASTVDDVSIVNRTPGKVIFIRDKCPVVVCGRGLLKVNRMTTDDGLEFYLKQFRTRFT